VSPSTCLPRHAAPAYDDFKRLVAAHSTRQTGCSIIVAGETMTQRINYFQQSPELIKKLLELSNLLKDGTIEETTRDLVSIRASQINGCGFCLDMHVKEARIHGERELRIHHLATWRESTLFAPRERAALAWTEALTQLPEHGVPDEIYERVRTQFSEKELSDLTFDVMVINAWNRANVAFKTVPGSFDKAFGLDKANLV
jgi:AhpD family alkylhydroperoxidase